MSRLASTLRSSIRQLSTTPKIRSDFGAVPEGFNKYTEPTAPYDNTERARRPLPSVNRVELIGGVASDVRISHTPNGKDVANFQLATNVEVRKVDGSLAQFTDFHAINVFGPLVRFVERNVEKGCRVVVNGRLSYTGGSVDELGNRTPKQARMSIGRLSAFTYQALRNVRPFSSTSMKRSEEQQDLFPPESSPDVQQRPRRQRPGINSVHLLGGVANNPLQRVARNGKEFCTFDMFTNLEQRRADGSFAEHTDLHHVVAHGPLARYVLNNVQKGSRVVIQGRLTYTAGQTNVSGAQIPPRAVVNADIIQPIARPAPRNE
ncbi:unnamed protein product [Bursaphelenchus okinawaensis]|uniref:Uncharacterized protein n=1 Tax=Bursaphelenchus okinawaensis TaxID=465554 RepID=A0A811KFB5_9BILA|nr:unnamed protein product [Bursaphelenchus okinawaensis]CAG9102757.1 unnamed protein product [Bursaphelenchus okinawaensis]